MAIYLLVNILHESGGILKRYERNFNSLSIDEQLILNNSSVAIVGLGGLGGYILENLVRLGVKNFTLIDMDVFEESNLNRQILSHENNLGKPKAKEAEIRAKLIDKDIKTKAFVEKLDKNSFHLLEDVDLVFDALDSIKRRISLEKLCEKMDLPLVYGTISGFLGNVGLSTKNNRIIQKIYGDTEDYENTLGNLPMTCMVTASLQVNLGLKLLLNKEYTPGELTFINVEEMTIDKLEI